MGNANLVPMVPERHYGTFFYLVRIGWLNYAIFFENYLLQNVLPVLWRYVEESEVIEFYSFQRRERNSAVFRLLDSCNEGRSEKAILKKPRPVFTYLHQPMMFLDEWHSVIALYYDFMAAAEKESELEELQEEKNFFVILDKRDEAGQLLERRLIYSLRSEFSARHFLRQHCVFQQNSWEMRNSFECSWESVFAKAISVEEIEETARSIRLSVMTRFPHARKKKPFVQEWHWHISRTLPLVQADSRVAAPEEREDERWNFRPGDPKLLRETGSGLYGSYPMFEGDDEPEFRDES